MRKRHKKKGSGIMMYPNLNQEINSNNMSWRSVAKAINMPESTFRAKITNGSFAVEEAFDIKNLLFPKYDPEYLFRKATSPERLDEVS